MHADHTVDESFQRANLTEDWALGGRQVAKFARKTIKEGPNSMNLNAGLWKKNKLGLDGV